MKKSMKEKWKRIVAYVLVMALFFTSTSLATTLNTFSKAVGVSYRWRTSVAVSSAWGIGYNSMSAATTKTITISSQRKNVKAKTTTPKAQKATVKKSSSKKSSSTLGRIFSSAKKAIKKLFKWR